MNVLRASGKIGPANRATLVNKEITYLQTEPNTQLNVCTTSVTEGEVAGVKLV